MEIITLVYYMHSYTLLILIFSVWINIDINLIILYWQHAQGKLTFFFYINTCKLTFFNLKTTCSLTFFFYIETCKLTFFTLVKHAHLPFSFFEVLIYLNSEISIWISTLVLTEEWKLTFSDHSQKYGRCF